MRVWAVVAAVVAVLPLGMAALARDPVPPLPTEARAAKAYAALDIHCARCHQSGRLIIPAPAQPLANILALDEIARQPTILQPGVPDASSLYTIMIRHHPAVDLQPAPPAEAVQAVRDWIQVLAVHDSSSCPKPIGRGRVNAAIAASVAAAPREKLENLRFVSLTHLYNACVAPAALERFRQAIGEVVNSLTWATEPVRLEPIDEALTVMKVDLAEIGWTAAQWEALVAGYPYAGFSSAGLPDAELRRMGTLVPVVRGDWFAHAAMTPPLYSTLLGLPSAHVQLQRRLNVHMEASAARGVGVSKSAVTRGPRLIERHPTRTGSLWLAYDFATGEAWPEVIGNPLAPSSRTDIKSAKKHDGMKSLFTLPNGFFAYSLFDARGDRVDHSPAAIEREETLWAGPVTSGASCMACHKSGPIVPRDAARARGGANGPDDTVPDSNFDMADLIAEDQARYEQARRSAGIDPVGLVNGLEPVAARALEYTRDVDLDRLAAEAHLPLAELQRKLQALPVELQLSVRRLKLATASRAEVDRILARLAPDSGGAGGPMVVVESPSDQSEELELLIWPSSDSYAVGDEAAFFARSSQDCHLTLINVDAANRATVLFPNEFEPNNLLPAGEELRLPAETGPYRFRMMTRGRETLVGTCSTVAKSTDGIVHDFERQRFTALGDWRAHLDRALSGEKRDNVSATPPPRAKRRDRGRPAPPATKADAKTVDVQARAAIAYEVR